MTSDLGSVADKLTDLDEHGYKVVIRVWEVKAAGQTPPHFKKVGLYGLRKTRGAYDN